ncbi:CDC48 family AAA ATPase [archaeon]|nr:CDC48 family AAA ATPase [archaeon]
MIKKEVHLKVGEIPSNAQSDIGIGIVRFDTAIMSEIGIREGDVVEIEGKRKTGSIAIRPYPSDTGLSDIIRMDGYMRRNAKTSIGEKVTIRKAELKEAKKITIAPAEQGVIIQVPGAQIKKSLLGRITAMGDVIVPTTPRRSRNSFFDMNIEDIFSLGFGEMRFSVIKTIPSGIVKITDLTEFEVLPQAVKIKEVEETPLPVTTYEDIGGLKEEVKKVREMIELPLKHPELFERLGIEPPKGVLLYGPPGTGKTLLAKAVANESRAHFISLNGPEITSKWYGESEKKIRDIFKQAEENAPTIIFIDEIDAIAPKRETVQGEVERRMVAQLLASMDGLKSRGQIIVLAATNRENALDPALRRGGRFDREIEIGVPDREGRIEVLQIHMRNMPLKPSFDGATVKNYLKNNDDIDKKIADILLLKNMKLLYDSLFKKEEKLILQKPFSEFKEKFGAICDTDELKKTIQTITKLKDLEKLLFNYLDENNPKRKEFVNIVKQNSLFLVSENKIMLNITKTKILKLIDESDIDKKRKNEYIQYIEQAENDKIAKRMFFGLTHEEQIELNDKFKKQMIEHLANVTHGYVGADMASLTKEAAMSVLRRILPDINLKDDTIPASVLKKLEVRDDDFKNALMQVEPSAMREVLIDIPNIKWDQVGGLDEAKQYLKEMVEWPLNHPEAFTNMGITPPKGILLYGVPGTGKTLLAKAVANESDANFISIKGPELLSKWVGESEKHIREMFKKAKQVAPCIIFFDEIDSIAPKRGHATNDVTDKVVTQMLTEMDGLEGLEGVIIIGATNRPDIIDPALMRPGRFDRHVYVPVPDLDTKKMIFKIHTKNMPLSKDIHLLDLAKKSENYVGADIEALCREAAINALRADMNAKEVTLKDFNAAFEKVKGSVDKKALEIFKKKIEDTQIQPPKQEFGYVG